ncbi:OmpA family protein [Mariniphaga sp.]|uniref:OmpA family protein n=1 Tax=Mariniphaga sp. TaxID=1954475 RepID=UPI003567BF72
MNIFTKNMIFKFRLKAKYLLKRGLVLLILLLFAGKLAAQPNRRVQKWFDEARQMVSRQEYSQAINRCNQILERDSTFLDARLLLADIFHETKNTTDEVFHLKKAIEKTNLPLVTWRLGLALMSLENYAEALSYFQNYIKNENISAERRKEAEQKIKSCVYAVEAIKNPVDFQPDRLPVTINSPSDEYWPSLSIDQQKLVFTRLIKKPGYQPQEDFYTSEFFSNTWQKAIPMDEINTAENEGAQTLSADGNLLLFTACNRPGGMGSCDIYYSIRKDGRWSKAQNAGKPLNTSSWEAQPSISSDGRFLYFSGNRPGGKGEKDIWRAELLEIEPNGRIKWGTPVNLGDSINTPGNETSPFVHAGNKNFYFASDYHVGLGGFDLFVSDILGDSVFSFPRNLGYPINTVNDEQGLHISADGLTAFFSSARDSLTGLDIYSFELDESVRPHPATYVKATVVDVENGKPLEAEVALVNLGGITTETRIENTNTSGELLLCLPSGNNYSFSVAKEGYLFYSNTFDLRNSRQFYNPYELEIALTPIKEGAEMNLHNIYFETDSFRILPESEPELQKLVVFLEENPTLKVEVQGHTDDTGLADKNLMLSEKRARSVVEYLVSNQINKNRLTWAGFGENRPVSENDTPEGRQMNRRTTIKILNN